MIELRQTTILGGTPVIRRWASVCFLLILLLLSFLFGFGFFRREEYEPWNYKAHMSPPDLALVLPKLPSDSITWALKLAPLYTIYAYSTSYPSEPPFVSLGTPNRGRETLTYLSFIVENYDVLPTVTAFAHARETQWHNDLLGASTADLLRHLDVEKVKELGYVNLRCSPEPGCPISVLPLSPSPQDYRENGTRALFASIYSHLFNVPQEKVPDRIGGICCAQFAVSRERILARPRSDYERMRTWVLETEELDDYGIGWVFEKVWHVVFGMEAVHCPALEECRCNLVAWCGKEVPGHLRDLVLGAHPWLGSRLGRVFGNDYAAGDWI